MNNKELITRAKEIILKGAKQVNIELPEFELTMVNKLTLKSRNPMLLLRQGFIWDDSREGFNYWKNIYETLPTTLNT